MINEYAALSTRAGFNRSLGHFRLVTSLVEQLEQGRNLADLIDDLEKEKEVNKAQIGPILNALVVEKYGFHSVSFNLPVDIQDLKPIHEMVSKWNRLEMVIAYHHPQLGITLINPKKMAHWEGIQDISRNELAVLYATGVREKDKDVVDDALKDLRLILEGRKPGNDAKYKDASLKDIPKPAPAAQPAAQPAALSAGARPAPSARPVQVSARPAAPAAPAAKPAEAASPAAAGGRARMTPKYSVQVTNELFHNGNVEAWKNIIESFRTKFSDLEVHIFHDGEKVNDINSLFKWGKVKHGDVLLFSVAGEDIKGIAKLQRYLFEGASIRFHNFLKKDVNKVLNLF